MAGTNEQIKGKLVNFADSANNPENPMSAYNDYPDDTIGPDQWTLYDKILYGGFGYSAFCLPDNIITIALTIIFPPLGMISALISRHLGNTAPWFTVDAMRIIFDNFSKIVYSFILTSLFYLPGLIYVMRFITHDDEDESDVELYFIDNTTSDI